MKFLTLCFAALLATSAGVSSAKAQLLEFTVTTDSAIYNIGDTVNWAISATASGVAAGNFGIQNIAVDMNDSGAHALTPGTIGAPFADYNFPTGGTPVGVGNLTEIAATLFTYNAAAAEAPFGGLLGPLELATGSFTAANSGTLSLSDGSANRFFTSTIVAPIDVADFGTQFVNANYSVTAVPEPGSFAMFGVALIGLARRRRG